MVGFIGNTIWFALVGWWAFGMYLMLGILLRCTFVLAPLGSKCFNAAFKVLTLD